MKSLHIKADRLQTWAILGLSLLRWTLILLLLYFGWQYIKVRFLGIRIPCYPPSTVTVNSEDANEIALLVSRTLESDWQIRSNQPIYAFENPPDNITRVWRYYNGEIKEQSIGLYQEAIKNKPNQYIPAVYNIFIYSYRWNKAVVCIDFWSGGYEYHMGGGTLEWTVKRQFGQWTVVSRRQVMFWDGPPLPE